MPQNSVIWAMLSSSDHCLQTSLLLLFEFTVLEPNRPFTTQTHWQIFGVFSCPVFSLSISSSFSDTVAGCPPAAVLLLCPLCAGLGASGVASASFVFCLLTAKLVCIERLRKAHYFRWWTWHSALSQRKCA